MPDAKRDDSLIVIASSGMSADLSGVRDDGERVFDRGRFGDEITDEDERVDALFVSQLLEQGSVR